MAACHTSAHLAGTARWLLVGVEASRLMSSPAGLGTGPVFRASRPPTSPRRLGCVLFAHGPARVRGQAGWRADGAGRWRRGDWREWRCGPLGCSCSADLTFASTYRTHAIGGAQRSSVSSPVIQVTSGDAQHRPPPRPAAARQASRTTHPPPHPPRTLSLSLHLSVRGVFRAATATPHPGPRPTHLLHPPRKRGNPSSESPDETPRAAPALPAGRLLPARSDLRTFCLCPTCTPAHQYGARPLPGGLARATAHPSTLSGTAPQSSQCTASTRPSPPRAHEQVPLPLHRCCCCCLPGRVGIPLVILVSHQSVSQEKFICCIFRVMFPSAHPALTLLFVVAPPVAFLSLSLSIAPTNSFSCRWTRLSSAHTSGLRGRQHTSVRSTVVPPQHCRLQPLPTNAF